MLSQLKTKDNRFCAKACKNVEEKHALIEYHPVTHSYWFRQIGRKTSKSYHSIGNAKEQFLLSPSFIPTNTTIIPASSVNTSIVVASLSERLICAPNAFTPSLTNRNRVTESLHYGAMVELHPADTLRFGDGETVVDYVFETPSHMPQHNTNNGISQKQPARPVYSSSANSTSSSLISEKKPSAKKVREATSQVRSSLLKCEKIDDGSQNFVLPVVGSRIRPKRHSDRWSRPQHQNQRMCQMMNTSSLPKVKSTSSNSESGETRKELATMSAPLPPPSHQHHRSVSVSKAPLPHGRVDSNLDTEGVNNSVGNQLLQRVIRLQAELQRKDAEIARLRDESQLEALHQHKNPSVQRASNGKKNNPDSEKLQAAATLNGSFKKETVNEKVSFDNFIEIIDNTFFAVCCEELDTLNQRVSNASLRDYGDVFTETAKALQEPFSFRLMEINTKCSLMFEQIPIAQSDREQLYLQFDKFLKEKIYPISKAFDSFLPILKDAAMTARESVRACSVFSQWSREFGDQLQLQPNWELMAYKVDDLQTRFKEFSMPKHWLPPSLTPLLKILVYEYKNRFEEYKRKELEYTENIAKIESKLLCLRGRLKSSEDQALISEIIGHKAGNGEESILVENERLRLKIAELESRIRRMNSSRRESATDLERMSPAIAKIPSQSSIQRDFSQRIEEDGAKPSNSADDEALTDEDDVYRNSSTNGSSTVPITRLTTVTASRDEDDGIMITASHSRQDEKLGENSDSNSMAEGHTIRRRSAEFQPSKEDPVINWNISGQEFYDNENIAKLDENRRPESMDGNTIKSGQSRASRLSECSNKTAVEDSEQMLSQNELEDAVDEPTSSKNVSGEEVATSDNEEGLSAFTAFNDLNKVYDELRAEHQKKRSRAEFPAAEDVKFVIELDGTADGVNHKNRVTRSSISSELNEECHRDTPMIFSNEGEERAVDRRGDNGEVDQHFLESKESPRSDENLVSGSNEQISRPESNSHEKLGAESKMASLQCETLDVKDDRHDDDENSEHSHGEPKIEDISNAILVNNCEEMHTFSAKNCIEAENEEENVDISEPIESARTEKSLRTSEVQLASVSEPNHTPPFDKALSENEMEATVSESCILQDNDDEDRSSENELRETEAFESNEIDDESRRRKRSMNRVESVDENYSIENLSVIEELATEADEAETPRNSTDELKSLESRLASSAIEYALKDVHVDNGVVVSNEQANDNKDSKKFTVLSDEFVSNGEDEVERNISPPFTGKSSSSGSQLSIRKKDSILTDFQKRESSSASLVADNDNEANESDNDVNRSRSRAPISQHQRNAIEFWELATMLAQTLRIELPPHHRSRPTLSTNTSPLISSRMIAFAENVPLQMHRPRSWPLKGWYGGEIPPATITHNAEEFEARQRAADSIVEKLEKLLADLQKSANPAIYIDEPRESTPTQTSTFI